MLTRIMQSSGRPVIPVVVEDEQETQQETLPSSPQQLENDSLESANELVSLVMSQHSTPAAEYTLQQQINFWHDLANTQTGDPNQPGTLLYRAISARDFFSELADIQHDNLKTGLPPQQEINRLLNVWLDYSTQMSQRQPQDRIGIDLWYSA